MIGNKVKVKIYRYCW